VSLLALNGCSRPPDPPPTAPPSKVPTPSRQTDRTDYNVVLVSFDALQAAHVGCLGYSRDVTPTIDAVAARGYLFSEARSVASWTVPASMSWFTGVYPSEHRMTNKYAIYNAQKKHPARLRELAPQLTTLAEVMKHNGYATGGFTGNAGVSGGFGYDQGFDEYYYEKQRFGGFDQSIPKALEWLAAHRDEKFFLFLHGYDCHGQSTPEGGYDYRYVDEDYDGRFIGSVQEQEILREEGLANGHVTLRDADVRFWRAVYDEKIARADEKFRRFLEAFDELGLTDKTIFVLTSDHGTEFHEHRRFDHGFTLYDEQIHVPLIITMPNGAEGRVIDERISSIDVMPTILDLAGVEVSEKVRLQMRGRSLVARMQGRSEPRPLLSETDYREYTYKRAIVTPDGWKFIHTLETSTSELYHLPSDSGETENLVETEPERARELEGMLFDSFRSIGHDLRQKRWEIGLNPVYNSQGN